MITLEQALTLVRELQPMCMNAGYYLALAGGVLNTGVSENDLDLVAVPRVINSTPIALGRVLATKLIYLGSDRVRSAVVTTWSHHIGKIEIAIIE